MSAPFGELVEEVEEVDEVEVVVTA